MKLGNAHNPSQSLGAQIQLGATGQLQLGSAHNPHKNLGAQVPAGRATEHNEAG